MRTLLRMSSLKKSLPIQADVPFMRQGHVPPASSSCLGHERDNDQTGGFACDYRWNCQVEVFAVEERIAHDGHLVPREKSPLLGVTTRLLGLEDSGL